MGLQENLTRLCSLSPEDFAVKNPEDAWKILDKLNDDLLFWIIDLMTFIASFEVINKMGPRSIATVFAPNVYVLSDPVKSMNAIVDVVSFLTLCVKKRLETASIELPTNN